MSITNSCWKISNHWFLDELFSDSFLRTICFASLLLSCNINPTKQRNRFTQPYSNICINKNCKPLLPRVIFTSQLFNYPHEVLAEHSRLLSSKSILKLSTLPLSFPVTFNYFPSKAGTLQLIPKSCYYSVETAINRHVSKSLAGVREFRLGNCLFKS